MGEDYNGEASMGLGCVTSIRALCYHEDSLNTFIESKGIIS
ncbi:hypothetical protein JCM19235_2720 [Vibrio maritimus]|uniref:Uncharacterized protein n=2 Tax=Vibrio TaxID=662 RepID=A0A090S3B8_9VIBR|nr:hypothetical protein JCM19235_2720 [Vibrio maritimus]GAL24172.1 hypothetical protein JCM19239_3875 [Vibrio variabilis]